MFDFMVMIANLLSKCLVSMGLTIVEVRMVSRDYMYIKLKNNDDYCFDLTIGEYADKPDTMIVTFGKGEEEDKCKEVISMVYYKSTLTKDEIISVFKEFIKDEPLKNIPVEKSFFYAKVCGKCGTVYFKEEVNEDLYDNLADNENIQFFPSRTENIAQITSVCGNCTK